MKVKLNWYFFHIFFTGLKNKLPTVVSVVRSPAVRHWSVPALLRV